MKKQKIVSLLLAVSCVLGLTACGSKDNGSVALGVGVVCDVAAGNMLYSTVFPVLSALDNEPSGLGLNAKGLPSRPSHCGFRGFIHANIALGQFPAALGQLTYQHVSGGAGMMLNQKRNFRHFYAPSSMIAQSVY